MSNARIVKIFKLVNGIDISLKEYNPAEVFIKKYDPFKVVIDSDDFEAFYNKNESPVNITSKPEKAVVLNMNSA